MGLLKNLISGGKAMQQTAKTAANSPNQKIKKKDEEEQRVQAQSAQPAKTAAEKRDEVRSQRNEERQRRMDMTSDERLRDSKQKAAEKADSYTKPIQDLEDEKRAKSDIWVDGIYMGSDKYVAEAYDKRINKLKEQQQIWQQKADKVDTDEKRDDALAKYRQAVADEQAIAGYATDPLAAAGTNVDQFRVAREQAEDALKEENRRKGNDIYADLSDEARSRDMVEGFEGERMSQYGAALGTAAEWLDYTMNAAPAHPEDYQRGALGDWGAAAFENSKAVAEQAEADWGDFQNGMGEGAQYATNIGKTVANTAADMMANLMVPGAGRLLMGARAAGGGAMTQDQREKNDIDSRMTKAILDGSVAYLSEWFGGGAEAAYGRSVIGKYINQWANAKGLSSLARRALNTEGLEEGLEYGLGYIGDRILGLVDSGDSFWSDWNNRELAENVIVGYLIGCIFNGTAGGEEYPAKRIEAVVDEVIDNKVAEKIANGEMTMEDVVQSAMATPSGNVKIGGQKAAQVEEAAVTEPANKAEAVNQWLDEGQAAGREFLLTPEQAQQVLNDSEMFEAYREALGDTEESAREDLQETAGMAPAEKPETDDVREWVAERKKAYEGEEGKSKRTETDRNLDKLIEKRLKERAKSGSRNRGTVSFDGGNLGGVEVQGVDQNNLTRQQKRAVNAAQAVADALGLDIVFFSDKATDGNVKLGAWQGGKLYLNMDGAIRANKNGQSTSRFIVGATMSHELTHYLQEYDPDGYAELRDFVESTILRKDAGSMERMIKQQLKMDPSLSYDEALDEVVANACQTMLYDNKVVQKLARQNMTLFEKIADVFNSVGDKLRDAFAEVDLNDSDIYRAARLMKNETAELSRIWNSSMLAASENAQNKSVKAPADIDTNNQAAVQDAEEATGIKYSRFVEDPETLDFLEQQEKDGKVVKTYKSFLEIDGKLYPPMASMQKDENGKYKMAHAMEPGKWEESVGDPSKVIIDPKNGRGYYNLKKDNGETVKAAYNPYQHSSNLMLNDQFSGAYKRPNIVTYECIIPESELTSGYKAEYAKDAVGLHPWKSGIVAGKIAKEKGTERQVYLSRWLKPIRKVPEAEVAQQYKELLSGTDIAVPSNVVPPALLKALEDAGVKIEYTKQAPKAEPFKAESPAIQKDIDILSKVNSADGKTKFQVAAFENDEPEYRRMLLEHSNMTETQIDELFSLVDTAMETVKNNLEALDYAWDADINDRSFSPVKQNSDKLYKVSQDFSTLCRKRILQGVIAGQLSEAQGRATTKEENIAIRDALMALQKENKQIEVACALCYVESARMRSQKAINEFLKDREASIRNYFAGKTGREAEVEAETKERQAIYDEYGLVRGKGDDETMYDVRDAKTAGMGKLPTNLKKRIQEAKKAARKSYPLTAEQQAIVDKANKLPVTDFTTPEGLQKLAKNDRDIFNAFVLKVSAASKSKGIENDTWWRAGDSKSISDALIEQMNRENGLRTQSWSDFQVKHLMDYIAATIELSTRNAKQHAYTKVLDYVKLMGNTGVMINMSLIPTAEYNGKLEYDDVEGFKFKDAMEMREKFPDTAGTICIGMNNDQIHQLLESDEIDYVIPYHQSGMSKATRKMMHIPAWNDFQRFQGEKKLSGDAAEANAKKYGVKLLDESDPKWHEAPAFSEWFDLKTAQNRAAEVGKKGKYGVMTGGYAAMQEAAESYKRLCAERGLEPKFSYGDADFSGDPNYWKLLIDRKMVNNKTGDIIEQKAIKPNFDMDTIQEILNDELDRYGRVKADQDEAIERVTEAFLSGKVKGGMSSEEIAKAMQKPMDNLAITAATQGQTYNPDVFDPAEELAKQPAKPKTKDAARTLSEAATGKAAQKGVNTQGNKTNAAEGGLNRTESSGGRRAVTKTAEILADATKRAPAAPRKVLSEGSGEEKVSKFYSNTMTVNGKAADVEPITYNVKSESESIANASARLKKDYQGMIKYLVKAEAWSGEMVDAAAIVELELAKDARRTGDKTALQEWYKIQSAKQRESARGVQAIAKQSRPGSANVFRLLNNEIQAVRQANEEAKKAGKTKDIVPEEVLKKAEKKAGEISDKMLDLEIEIDDRIESGMNDQEAREKSKDAYLDLIDEINAFRHTGLLQDAGVNEEYRNQIKENITQFRRMLSTEDIDYIQRFAAVDAAGISEDIHYKGKQDFLKRLNTWQKLAQLTGTGTWGRNILGNASFGLVDVLAANNPVTILADAILGKKTGKRSSGWEWGFLNKGARQAASRALNRSVLEIAANIDLAEDGQTKYDMGRNRTYDPDGKAMERLMSRWEQWNGYMLESSDAWFKGMASGSAEQAIREANAWGEDNLRADERESLSTEEAEKLTKDRQKELDEVKKQIAKYRTFQNDGVTAEAANEIRDWLNKKGAKLIGKEWKKGQFGLGTALMPYTKVPTNLAVKSLEFSPLGAAKGLAEMIKVMNDPKATMAQQNKAVTDFGRGMTGTALIALLAGLMKNAPWFKDWEAEEDKDVKAQNKAEGKSGVQVNWSMLRRYIQGDKNPEWQNGDQAVDISSMEPVNQLFTTASLIADGMPAGEALFRSSKDNLMGMPSLQALTNIENNIKYTDTPEDGWQTLLTTAGSTFGSVAGGMLPAPLRHAGTAADQYARDTSGNNAIERAWNQTLSSIPYARTTLPVKTDAFGNPVSAGSDMTRIKNQYLPFKYSQVNQSDASREIERIRKETGENYMPARTGPKSVQYGSGKNAEKITLTAKERKEYKDDLGQAYQEQVEKLITSTYYKQANDEAKAAMIAALESYTKDTAKVNFADEHDIDYDGNYAGVRELKNPGQYLGIRAGFTTGIKNEDFSSVDALLKSAKRMSEKDRQYMREHTDGFSTYYDLAADGVKAKSVDKYQDKLKARIDAAGKKSANGYDIFQTVVQGGFTNKEADAFMNRTKSDGSFYAGKGRHAVYEAVRAAGGSPSEALELWDVMDKNGNGTLTKSEFKAAIKKVPKDKRSAVSKAIREAMGW